MAQTIQVAIAVPLLDGMGVIVVTILNHALTLFVVINFIRHERRVRHAGAAFWSDVAIAGIVILLALIAHFIDIALWAALFRFRGEFLNYGTALYYSAINYTTLGSDVVMTAKSRLLGPLEATDAMLMFGVSTAMVFTIIQRLVQIRYPDLRD